LTHTPKSAARAAWRTGLVGLSVLLAGCAGTGPTSPESGGMASVPRQATTPAAPVSAATASTEPTRAAQPTAPLPSAAALPGATVQPSAAAPRATSGTPPTAVPQAAGPQVAAVPPPPPVVLAPQHRDLWARMRAGFAMAELDTPLVQEKERFYLQRPEALQRMFARGGLYLHYIVEEVEKRGMPTELALLPFVESAMNPVALSSAKAAGLWQFIPSTGKQYELSQNWWVDNRRDVVQSTRAALDYLQKIYVMHDRDWHLALASYNWGENAVARAVKNNRARGLPTDYLSLSMPAETRHYVPKLIALKHIVMNAPALGLALPELPDRPYFATIEKTRPIDLKLAAQFAGMSIDEFVALNPAHNRPVIAATRNNQIKLPADRVSGFVAAVERHDRNSKPLASWQPYTLKPGESLDDVARRGSVSTAELMRANGLAPARKILPGTQVIAPQATVKDELQVESFEGPKVYEQITAPAVYHRVQKRDTLAGVAGSYSVSVAQLSAWNGGVKAVKPGASMMVRPASTQTLLTTADGARQIVARAEPPAAPAVPASVAEALRPAPQAAATPRAAAKSAAPPPQQKLAKAKPSAPRAQVARAPAARSPGSPSSVKTVYKPRPSTAKAAAAAAKTAGKKPRT
jgi:membrane-bound lytic murein transglycosylase D